MKQTPFLMMWLILCATSQLCLAQTAIQDQITTGGKGTDVLRNICPAKDGGLVYAGYSSSDHSHFKTANSRGGYDYWIAKYSKSHEEVWDRTIGGDNTDSLLKAIATPDGGYLLTGLSKSGISGQKTGENIGGYDYWIVKVNGKGKIQWDKTIGTPDDQWLFDADYTTDGGYILCGSLGLTKLDSLGNVQWQKTVAGSYIYSASHTSDGGYILLGVSDSTITDYLHHHLIKTDSNLNQEWMTVMGWYSYIPPGSNNVRQTSDGGYVAWAIAAGSYSESGNYYYDYEMSVRKFDKYGTFLWNQWVRPGYLLPDYHHHPLQETRDGGFILGATLTGCDRHCSAFDNYYLMRVDKNGQLLWTQTIAADSSDRLEAIQITSHNHYVLGGSSNSDVSGQKTRRKIGSYDYWTIYVRDTTGNTAAAGTVAAAASAKAGERVSIYPNPVRNVLYLAINGTSTISLTDEAGRIVAVKTIAGKGQIDVSGLRPGIYFLKNQLTAEVKKVVVVR